MNNELKLLTTFFILFILINKTYAQREIVSINNNWKFAKGNIENIHLESFNDTDLELITIPHTWNNLDGQDGMGYYRGIGWYRKYIEIPVEQNGRQIFIKFDAANMAADLYINGQYVGSHVGGYSAFVFDITSFITFGQQNLFAIKVNNSGNLKYAPLSADFTFCGGIYRDLNLIYTEKINITPLDFGSPGFYITQNKVTKEKAGISFVAKIGNHYNKDTCILVNIAVVDAENNEIWSDAKNISLAADTITSYNTGFIMNNPILWNGKKNPYLYHVTVTLKSNQETLDSIIQPLGVRYFSIDADSGFFLNGARYDLHGVCIHEDRENKGRAISNADRRQDIQIIDGMGATYIRLSHYQHDQLVYDICDSAGYVLWTEIPLINKIDSGNEFRENAKQQLVELIRQNYNHPSVFFWGIFNEITSSTGPDPAELVTQLNALAHAEDSTRLTVAAALMDGRPTNFITDALSYNVYIGWYWGSKDDVNWWLDKVHKTPDHKFGMSEYGAGGSVFHHELYAAKPATKGKWHPEEYQSSFHESYVKAIKSRPYLWANSIWNMYDFSSDSRDEGDRPGVNDKGMVTHDRKIRKDAYYLYKANWTNEPMVYITSRRFAIRNSPDTYVKIYSNCDTAELFVNDASMGIKAISNRMATWNGIVLDTVKNNIVVKAYHGSDILVDSCSWTYEKPEDVVIGNEIKINFQNRGITPPDGYLIDYGQPFGKQINGLEYGWSKDLSGDVRDRNSQAAPDMRMATLCHMQKSGSEKWEMVVDNNHAYHVTVGAGDPDNFDSYYKIQAEGVDVINFKPNSAQRLIIDSANVNVTDGRLTISCAPGSQNNKICFIDIKKGDTLISSSAINITPDCYSFFVYKNNEVLNVNVNTSFTEELRVSIYDVMGRIIYNGCQTTGNNGDKIISIPFYGKKGLYFIKLSNREQATIKRFFAH